MLILSVKVSTTSMDVIYAWQPVHFNFHFFSFGLKQRTSPRRPVLSWINSFDFFFVELHKQESATEAHR